MLFIATISIWYTGDSATRELGRKLELVLQSSHQSIRAWVADQRLSLVTVADKPEFRTALSRLDDPDCTGDCDRAASALLAGMLTTYRQGLVPGEEYGSLVLLTGNGEVIASSEPADRLATEVLARILRENASSGGFHLPQPLPAVPGKEPVARMFFSHHISDRKSGRDLWLGLILDPAGAFSRAVSLRDAIVPPPEEMDIYAFNPEGIVISTPTLAGKLIEAGLVSGGNAVLNVSLKNPGGDMLAGYRPDTPRDAQELTEMARSAISGSRGTSTGGYENYIGVVVAGSWLWDEASGIGVAVEMPRAAALLPARIVQWTILLFSLLTVIGIVWLVTGTGKRLLQAAVMTDRQAAKQQDELHRIRDVQAAAEQEVVRSRQQLEEEVLEKKKIMDQLHAAIRLQKSLMDASNDGILLTRGGGSIVEYNHRFTRIWGLDGRQRLSEKQILEGMAYQLDGSLDDLLEMRTGDPAEEVPETLVLRNGSHLQVLSLAPLVDTGEGVHDIGLLVFRPVRPDSTSMDEEDVVAGTAVPGEATDEALNLQKLMCVEILARGVSHEYNNILAAIFGYAELVQRTLGPDHEVGDFVKELIEGANRLGRLVQGFLGFSRNTTDSPEVIDLTVLIENTLVLLEQVLPLNIRIHRHYPEQTVHVHVCPEKMYQGLLVLLFDAIEKLSRGGEIHLTAGPPEDGFASLVVSGVPDHSDSRSSRGKRTQVAERFEHAEAQIRALKQLLHRQHCSLEYRGDGDGMSASLKVPEAGAEVPPVTTELLDDPEGYASGGFILLVPEDEDSVSALVRALEGSGYGVLMAADSLKALELFRSNPSAFSMVFADLSLSGLSGDVLIQEMLDLRPDLITFLCVTGDEPRHRNDFHGVSGLVHHPLALDEINTVFQSFSLPEIAVPE